MNCTLMEVDGLNIVLLIVVVIKLVMGIMVNDVVFSLMGVGRVVVNRLAMGAVLDLMFLFAMLDIKIEGRMNSVLVEVNGLDIVLIIVVVIKFVMGLMVDSMVFSFMGVRGVVVNRFAMDAVVNRVRCLRVLDIGMESAMNGVLVVMDGLDIMLIIVVVIKLVMGIMIDDVVLSLMGVGGVVVNRLMVSDWLILVITVSAIVPIFHGVLNFGISIMIVVTVIITSLVVGSLRLISLMNEIKIDNRALLDFIKARLRRGDLWFWLFLRDLRLLSLGFGLADIQINILMMMLVDKSIIIKVPLSVALVLAMSRVLLDITGVATHMVGLFEFSLPWSML